MALITCPECGRKISTKADFCPQCGCKITFSNKIGNNHNNANVNNYSGTSHPSDNKKINLTAILITIIIALAAIACIAMLRKGKDKSSPTNITEKVDTLISNTNKGWQYDINESNGDVVASIVADNKTITLKYMASNANSILLIMNTSKTPNFKENKLLGVSFDNVNHLCETQRDMDAGSPTYRVALNAELIEKFKTIPKFSLIFDDEEVTFSSSQALNMPSTEQSQQQSAQQGPTQQHRESRSNRNNEEWEDDYESPSDQVFATPTLIKNYPKQPGNADVPTRTRPTAESDHQKTDDARPTNELLQKEKEEHRRQILVVSNEDN